MHKILRPGMKVKLISSAAHGRCHSLPPCILTRLILLETVPIQVITQPRHASWEHSHTGYRTPDAGAEVQPAYHYATVSLLSTTRALHPKMYGGRQGSFILHIHHGHQGLLVNQLCFVPYSIFAVVMILWCN